MFIFYCLHKADDQITYSNGYNRRNKTRNLKGVIDHILTNSGGTGPVEVNCGDYGRIIGKEEVTVHGWEHCQ